MPKDRPRAHWITSIIPSPPIATSTLVPYLEIALDAGSQSIFSLHLLSDHLITHNHHVAQPHGSASHHHGDALDTSQHYGDALVTSALTSTPSSLTHICVPHYCMTCHNLCLGPLRQSTEACIDTSNYEIHDMLDVGVDITYSWPFPRETSTARDNVGAPIRLKVFS